MTETQIDISKQARSLARYVDRLPASEYTIKLTKTSDGSPWRIAVLKEETIRTWELKRK